MHFPLPQRELAIITNPQSVRCVPSVIQHAWCALKSARGQTVNLDRLAVTAHLITPAGLNDMAVIDATRARVLPRIAARMAAITGGTAA